MNLQMTSEMLQNDIDEIAMQNVGDMKSPAQNKEIINKVKLITLKRQK